MVVRTEKPAQGGRDAAAARDAGSGRSGGAFTADNRHGALRDMNGDGRVTFADTFLGDLLTNDGGLRGGNPGMMASLGGARRTRDEAVAMVQQQGLPVTEQNVQSVMASLRPQARGEGEPVISDDVLLGTPAMPADPAMPPLDGTPVGGPNLGPEDPALIDDLPVGADGNPIAAAATGVAAVAGGAGIAALIARARSRNRRDAAEARAELKAMGLGLDGEILDAPQITDGRPSSVARREARNGTVDGSVVDVNIPRSDNALPAPEAQTARTPQPSAPPAPTQPRIAAEDADLSGDIDQYVRGTQEVAPPRAVVDTPLPEGVTRDTQAFTGTQQERLVQAEAGPNGEQIFRDAQRGDFVVKDPNGGSMRAPTLDALRSALRAIR